MKTKLLALIVVVALLLGGVHVAMVAAQPLPSIVTFASSVKEITVDEAEAGATTTTLTWHTLGLTDEYRLRLHAYRVNRWEPVFDPDSVPLEARGARVVTIEHPLNFGPPTYLLSIVDNQSRIIDQRVLVIRYDVDTDANEPAINTFTVDVEEIDAVALADGSARVTVSWDVANRAPTTNLVFEQVFSDDTTASVELPRPNSWIPSSGQGPVAPVLPAEDGDTITLRAQLVDVVTDRVYDEQEITLDVIGSTDVPPDAGADPDDSQEPVAGQPATSPKIVAFNAEPDVVNPGAAVRLAWEVAGTGGVVIEQSIPNTTTQTVVVNAQSPQGATTVYLPDFAAYSVTYTLHTAARDASAEAMVRVNCPYTFFFGSGDSCPTGPAVETRAAYQEFEGGYMLWRGDTNEIYVHYDDNTAAYYLESSYADLPEAEVDEMPPLDRVAPSAGFGKVWANAPGVRDKLGWALAPEESYTMTIQQVATSRIPVPDFLFYLTLPDDSVAGTGFGQWRVVQE